MQRQRSNRKFATRPHLIDAQLSWNDTARLPVRNRRSACCAIENSTQCLHDQRSSCDFILPAPKIHALSPGRLKTPQPEENPRPSTGKRCPAIPV
ncbi:hypothetical protein NDU88_010444 [Pleurodeles waltl]|uniref:Uncharacterized protein n=1 Tax=Pleurodeles waltl TaxID=8319 RepID=A0AAV7S2N9_PLEWA|nr:hypothetical protein NDU88_010444 [Pleurodeles waltl]